jgi:membrane protease YdiL (CAAX protease family)
MQLDNIFSSTNTLAEKPKVKYGAQLGILLGFIGLAFMVAGMVQIGVAFSLLPKNISFDQMGSEMMKAMEKPENANTMRWMQLASAGIMFFVPTVLWALIISRNSFKFLGFNSKLNAKQIAIVIGISIFALILSGALGELNQMIPISKHWATKFKEMENAYSDQMMSIARMNNVAEYLFVLIVIGFAPALFEEVLFRGGLQQLLTNWSKKPLLAIIVTSIIFSAIHMSYYGFLPRFALGMVLGLIYYYGKNIWLNILMHLLNNGISVTIMFLTSKGGKPSQEVMDGTFPIYYGIVPLLAIIFFMSRFKKESEALAPENTFVYLKKEENPFAETMYANDDQSADSTNNTLNDGTEQTSI